MICSDFNTSVNRSNIASHHEDKRLINFAEEAFFFRAVNVLDFILIKGSDLMYSCEVGEPLTNSDHVIVSCVSQSVVNESKLQVSHNSRANFEGMTKVLYSVNWSQLLDISDKDELYSKFTTQFTL